MRILYGMKILAKNRRATFDYKIEDTFVTGLVLVGTEVKAAKSGHVQLKGSYVRVSNEEAWLLNSHISHYPNASEKSQHVPDRTRKLLLTKKQIKDLFAAKQNGKNIIPLSIGLDHGYLKLEIATATSKKLHDKRQVIKEREARRSVKSLR